MGSLGQKKNKDYVIKTLRDKFSDERLDYAFIRSLSKDDLEFLQPVLKHPVSGNSILEAFKKNGSSWYEALATKGVDVNEIRQRVPLSLEQITDIVAQVSEVYNLNSRLFQSLGKEEIKEITGYSASGAAIYAQVTTKYNFKWYDFLQQSGHNILQIRKSSKLTKEQIIYAITEISRITNPNYFNVTQLTKNELDFLSPQLGIRKSGLALVATAVRVFGSWDQALVSSGLNPDQIRKRGWADYKVLTPAMQYQRKFLIEQTVGQENFGYDKEQNRIAIEQTTSEDIVINKEINIRINNTLNGLNHKEQFLFDLLLETMSEQRLREDYAGFELKKLVQEVQGAYNVAPSEINLLFAKIIENKELQAALIE